jgi:hypothetical protein
VISVLGSLLWGLAMQTHLRNVSLKRALSNIIFLDDFNTKTKERELYWQRVNLETSEKSKPEL